MARLDPQLLAGIRHRSERAQIHLELLRARDVLVRRLLVGSAQYILGAFGPDSDLRRHGLAIAARGGKNAKKRAVVAVARKLGEEKPISKRRSNESESL